MGSWGRFNSGDRTRTCRETCRADRSPSFPAQRTAVLQRRYGPRWPGQSQPLYRLSEVMRTSPSPASEDVDFLISLG